MFKTYKASAGSGKTTNLVAEYLTICFTNPHKFRNILAITFTNNATAQMKERIISTLQNFAFESDYQNLNGSDKAILGIVARNLNIDSGKYKDFFSAKSKELLKFILYDYPNFSISTIDSFFQRLIRSFALELNLNLNFNLEIQLDDFFTQTIDILINKISKLNQQNKDNGLTERVLHLMENKLDVTGKSNFDNELIQILFSTYNEDSYLPLKSYDKIDKNLFYEKCRELKNEANKLRREIVQLASKADTLIKSTGLSAEDFYQGNKGPFNWFANIVTNQGQKSSTYMLKAIEKGAFTKNKEQMSDQLFRKLVDSYYRIVELQPHFLYLSILTQNIDALMLLFDLKSIMDDIKRRDNLFYLSETNAKIFDEIVDEETPYIYEKLGNYYSYFLIDEFQDTSKMQWMDIFPLLKNALSGSNQYGEAGKAIIFGDVKQAIYRFRNGDAALLNKLSSFEGFKDEFGFKDSDDSRFQLISLQTNYRSNSFIVDFNNLFFKYLKSILNTETPVFPMAAEYYQDVEQKKKPASYPGFVKINFNSGESEDYEDEQVLLAVREALSRKFDFQDIAVLTKDRKKGIRLARMLSENKIPVISADSLLLSSSGKVKLIIATIQYIVNQNSTSKLYIINYLDQDKKSPLPLNEALAYLQNDSSFTHFLSSAGIKIDKNYLLNLPLSTLVKEIIKLYNFREADLYIIGFNDVVIEYVSKNEGDLIRFLQWWKGQEDKLAITTPRAKNAVTVTTIHKAKGLEYPVVILPLNKYNEGSSGKTFWHKVEEDFMELPYIPVTYSKKLEGTPLEELYHNENNLAGMDNLNVLYVAHTRPCELLFIITGKIDKGNYSKFLYDFCSQNRENPDLFFEDDFTVWFGDRDYQKADKMQNSIQPKHTIQSIYTSDFTPESFQLAYDVVVASKKEQETGLFVHDFLSKLTKFPQTEKEIEEMQLEMDEDKKKTIKQVLRNIMQDESLKPYFADSATSLNEISILKPDGTVRRPDRLVILDDEVMVIDYKTGKENLMYEKQLQEYIELLLAMGYKNVKGRLVFV